MINTAQSRGDDNLYHRLFDLSGGSLYRPRFTHFLNEREQALAGAFLLRNQAENTLFYGGFPTAQRRVLGFFPPDMHADEAAFPFAFLQLRYGRDETLSHRDVLGTLTGMGLSRDSIGDILPRQGICRLVVLSGVAEALLRELARVGRTGVRCERADPAEFVLEQAFIPGKGTVSSMRLDCLVSLVCSLPRSQSAALIEGGMVQHNYRVSTSVAKICSAGDLLTVRGHGKFRLNYTGLPTRKNRVPVEYSKYN